MNAQQIAAKLSQTAHGRRVLALLLSCVDGDDDPLVGIVLANDPDVAGLGLYQPCSADVALRMLVGAALPADAEPSGLTQLGREVAALCRPQPLDVVTVDERTHYVASFVSADDDVGSVVCECSDLAVAERIAALLTADDLARAKRGTTP